METNEPSGGGGARTRPEPKLFYNLSTSATPRPRGFVVVTAASGNHLCQLQHLLTSLAKFEAQTKVLIYDLAWTPRLRPEWLRRFHPNILELKWFNATAMLPESLHHNNQKWRMYVPPGHVRWGCDAMVQ